MTLPDIAHRYIDVDGLRIFYREAGPEDAPVLLLLHGFPSASHQYRRLFDALGDRYRLIAPDYPGFGFSDAPSPTSTGGAFDYRFDNLAEVMTAFTRALRLDRFALYMFDFGSPVGFRLAIKDPKCITGLVAQNANAYEEGLSDMARDFIASRPDKASDVEKVHTLLTLEGTKGQYLTGVARPEHVAPDGWTLDQHFLDLPGRKQIQLDLAFDYHSNVERYPEWQAWLRTWQPPTLVLWGRNDPIFIEPGAHAYLRDVPDAELHLFDTGHFALEEDAPRIAPLIAQFMERLG